MTPWVGATVHYTSFGTPIRTDGSQAFTSRCRAAIVTEVDPDDPAHVGLYVANPTGEFFHPLAVGGCHQDEEGHSGGSWHWPCDKTL